jgi:hypothetical protein
MGKNEEHIERKSQLHSINPRGHKEDLGLLSHSKSQHKTTNSQIFFDLPQETLRKPNPREKGENESGREVRR